MTGNSLNGTGVLARMFQRSGHRVMKWTRLSPKLEQSQVIVWAPDDFSLPREKQTDFLDNWLANEPNRTLIFIGRDFDATTTYWQNQLQQSTNQNAIELRRKLEKAKAAKINSESNWTADRDCRWFRLSKDESSIDADIQWADQLDQTKLTISPAFSIQPKVYRESDESTHSYARLQSEPLVADDANLFATRLTSTDWYNGQIIVVANGSTLLNYPLLNSENRKMAGKLISLCPSGSRVTFLQSGKDGILVSESDASSPAIFRAFTVWPINFLMLHFTVLGIIFCFIVFPIFGRPHKLPEEQVSDFGKHVAAVGDLLQICKGNDYVRNSVQQYREINTDRK